MTEVIDKLNRGAFATKLTEAITSYIPFHEEAYVLSLNAGYGQGKTTFLDIWAEQLQTDEYEVIRINAWESDLGQNPLFAVVDAFIKHVGSHEGVKQNLANAAYAAIGGYALAANGLFNKATGVNVLHTIERVEGDLSEKKLKTIGRKLDNKFDKIQEVVQKLRVALEKYVEAQNGKPIMIFVDELDRVRPNYAVEFLEVIKHIFSVKGLCFVLAVDRKQLEASVSQLYGNIDFENYYLRFITREAHLPKPNQTEIIAFTTAVFQDEFNKMRVGNCSLAVEGKDIRLLVEFSAFLTNLLGFSLRQVHHFKRAYSQFMMLRENQDGMLNKEYIAMIMIALSLNEKTADIYRKLGQDSMTALEIKDYFDGQGVTSVGIQQSKVERHFAMELLAAMMMSDDDKYKKGAFIYAIEQWRIFKKQEYTGQEAYGYLRTHYGIVGCKTVCSQIYQSLEAWKNIFDE